MKLKKKDARIKKISKTMQKFLSSKYTTRAKILESRLKEINEHFGKEESLNDDEFSKLTSTIEPVCRLYGDCFIAFNSERFAYGIVNLKTNNLVIPCEYTDIQLVNHKEENVVILTDLMENKKAYIVSKSYELQLKELNKKSSKAREIAMQHNFIAGVDISKSEKII